MVLFRLIWDSPIRGDDLPKSQTTTSDSSWTERKGVKSKALHQKPINVTWEDRIKEINKKDGKIKE